MTDQRTPSGPCPVEVGEECAMPGKRKWDWNLPSLIAILGLLGVWFGSFMSYIVLNDRRATKTEGEVEVLKTVDKGIIDHASAVEQTAMRDRMEMREDIREIKSDMKKLLMRAR